MHGLADLQHDVVGNVHHVGDAAQAAQRQLTAHPAGRGARRDVVHVVADIPRAEIRRFHRDGKARVGGVGLGIVQGGHLQGLVQHGGHFPGDAQDALAVGTVGGDGDIKDIVVQPHHLLDGRAGDGVLGQVQQAVHLGAGIEVLVEAQFLAAAEHAVGFHTHQRFCLDLDPAGQRGAVQGGGGVHARVNVGRTGGDLDIVAVLAAIHLADVQVGALLRNALGDHTHNNLVDIGGQIDELLHLKATVEEFFLQLLGGDINVYILFQPAEWYFHSRLPPLNPRTASGTADRFRTSVRCC